MYYTFDDWTNPRCPGDWHHADRSTRTHPAQSYCEDENPDHHDGDGACTTARTTFASGCFGAEFSHQIVGHQPHDEQDPGRDNDDVVQVSEHGDEIGNEIDRRERIGRYDRRQQFHVPRHTWIARGDPDRNDVSLDLARPGCCALQHGKL